MLKYKELANEIERFIQKENMTQGDKLPNLDELAVLFGSNKSTIRRSLKILESRGCVYRLHGSGIFVRTLNVDGYINVGFHRGFLKTPETHQIEKQILEIQTETPPRQVANYLNIEASETVHFVKRLVVIDGKPLAIEETYFITSVVPHLDEEIVASSIFRHVREDLKLKMAFSDSYLHVDKLSEEEADFLQLEIGDPRPCSIKTFYLANGQPFNHSQTIFNYKEAKFFIQDYLEKD